MEEGGCGMNVVKYLCEFFFCNFWHYLELCLVLVLLCPWNRFTINTHAEKEEEERDVR